MMNRVLPQGTAYVTDVGMVGPRDGILGMERNAVFRNSKHSCQFDFVADEGKWHFHAVVIELNDTDRISKRNSI